MSAENLSREAATWVAQLLLLQEDRRALSELRRCCSEPGRNRALPWLVPLGAAGFSHQEGIRRCLCLLFARGMKPATRRICFASTWRDFAWGQVGAQALEPSSSYSRRLMWLLDAERSQIAERLIPVALRMRGDAEIDLVGLYLDLLFWGDKVKMNWGKNYWTQEAAR
ncbi:MAG: hypothetical protein RL095_441 [Verrucomicrobiota bacterium]|jgi:hypothetical protein